MQIDKIVARTVNIATPRRLKIYCDKWIHEGVCAFTQLGCKYKHEMPTDKATQMSLGLNHGLPAWYKRAHGVQLREPVRESQKSLLAPAVRSPASPNSWRGSSDPTSSSPDSGPRSAKSDHCELKHLSIGADILRANIYPQSNVLAMVHLALVPSPLHLNLQSFQRIFTTCLILT